MNFLRNLSILSGSLAFRGVNKHFKTNTFTNIGHKVLNLSVSVRTCTGSLAHPQINVNIENAHAFNVVEKLIDKDSLITSCGNDDILEKVKKDPSACSDEEIIQSLQFLSQKGFDDANFNETWRYLDKECARRVKEWVPSKALAVATLFFKMGVAKSSSCVWNCLKKHLRRLDKLNTSELVQAMFLVSICRKFPETIVDYDLQLSLVNHFEAMSLDQMAVVCLAFFKCMKKIKNSTVMSIIIRKFSTNVNDVDSFTMTMICKIITYSLPLTLADELYVLQEKLIPELPKIRLMTLAHVALIGNNVLVCNEKCIVEIIKIFKCNLSAIRLKDIERLLLVMSMFRISDDELVDMICEQMAEREKEIHTYPKAFISLVNYLIVMGIFKSELINKALSMDFIKDAYGNYKRIGGELIYVDKSVEIEYPDYKGNRLEPVIAKNATKAMAHRTFATATSSTKKFSFELESFLKLLYPPQSILYTNILPHYTYADFLIGFDEQGNPVNGPSSDWQIHRWAEVKHLPDKKHHWLAVIIGGWNMVQRNNQAPLGILVAKTRQLQRLGYHPVLISFLQWKEETDKKKFVTGIINKKLTEIIN